MTDVEEQQVDTALEGRAPIRVAHLVSHPIQYFAPLYRELASRPEIDLTVYFYSDATLREFRDPEFGRMVTWDVPLVGGFRARILPSARRTEPTAGLLKRPNADILREVARERYDVVWVNGYAHLTTWLAVVVARATGAQVLIRDEQTLLHGRPWHKRLSKNIALRLLYSQASGLYIGEENRRYFSYYGMPDERLFSSPYCVDNAFFARLSSELEPKKPQLQRAFGLAGDAPVILFVGKLIEKKQPLLLLDAFADVRREWPCALLLVGDGPLRPEIERRIADEEIQDVQITGFLGQTDLARAYAAADVFVLPSIRDETWGLVVNEALNFALPVVVSDKVGCAPDLVRQGENGYVVPAGDRRALAQAVSQLVADDQVRRRFGCAGWRRIQRYSVEACADGIVAACVTRARRRRRG